MKHPNERGIQLTAEDCKPGRPWRLKNRRIHVRPPDTCERPGCTRPASCLDHDHKTGLIRGWLCNACNGAFASFGDDVDGLLNAVAYLRRHIKEK